MTACTYRLRDMTAPLVNFQFKHYDEMYGISSLSHAQMTYALLALKEDYANRRDPNHKSLFERDLYIFEKMAIVPDTRRMWDKASALAEEIEEIKTPAGIHMAATRFFFRIMKKAKELRKTDDRW